MDFENLVSFLCHFYWLWLERSYLQHLLRIDFHSWTPAYRSNFCRNWRSRWRTAVDSIWREHSLQFRTFSRHQSHIRFSYSYSKYSRHGLFSSICHYLCISASSGSVSHRCHMSALEIHICWFPINLYLNRIWYSCWLDCSSSIY